MRLTYATLIWTLESLTICNTMYPHMSSQKNPHFVISPSYTFLDNLPQTDPNEAKNSGPYQNIYFLFVFIWNCSNTLSKTKLELMINLFCLVKNNL